ncbi:MAG: HEAT repeat domain-containing protein [Planctomycetia bacterium]|nr:HEAT repeat domain-containing protein [Planctomycetia bacterium]
MPRLLSLIALFVLALPITIRAEDTGVIELIRELRSVNVKRRLQAAESLGRLGPGAAPAVRALVSALSDQNLEVQAQALVALRQIGRGAGDAVPALIDLLKGDDSSRFGGAIDALGAIGGAAGDAAPDLLGFMLGEDSALSLAACRALLHILPPDREELKQAIPVLVHTMTSGDAQSRDEAAATLGSAGLIAVPQLVAIVEAYAKDSESAGRAAMALALMGRHAAPAVPALIKALQSDKESLVVQAAAALGSIGPGADAALPQLRKLLYGKSSTIRLSAVRALADIGPGAADAVSDIAAALKDRDEKIRVESTRALGKIGAESRPAIPALVAALADESESVKWHAVWALSQIGGKAVNPLIALLDDEKLRETAVVALGDIGAAARPAVRPFVALLAKPDLPAALRSEIILSLARIGPAADDAVPALLRTLTDEKSELRAYAAWALAHIGARQAVPPLVRVMTTESGSSDLSIVAPIAVLTLNPDSPFFFDSAMKGVVELLGHSSASVRQEAALALAAVGKKAAPAVPHLTAGLADPEPAVRGALLSAVAAIGPDAADALPGVIKALADPVYPVRYAASYAVGRIGPPAKVTAPLLEVNLLDSDPLLQFASAWALVNVEPDRPGLAGKCLEALRWGLKSSDARTREEAAQALGALGSDARPAVPDLESLKKDSDASVHKSASEALQKIGQPKSSSRGLFDRGRGRRATETKSDAK